MINTKVCKKKYLNRPRYANMKHFMEALFVPYGIESKKVYESTRDP